MTEKQCPYPGSWAVLCLLTCNSNSGPQPRLACAVSSGSVCTGTRTAGLSNLLRLQPEWAMRGWCHWLSLDCRHSQAVSTRKLPHSLNYATCLGFPFPTLCPRKTWASLITLINGMEFWRLNTHTHCHWIAIFYVHQQSREGKEVHVQLQQETCIHPFLSPTTSLKDKKWGTTEVS